MRILFLDDCPDRRKKFRREYPMATLTETAEGMIELLKGLEEPADIVFLDHDLGGEVYVDPDREDCGMEVVRWVEKNRPPVAKFVVHTHNDKVNSEMAGRLRAAGYHVEKTPFWKLIQ